MKKILIIEASHNHQATGSRHAASLIEQNLRDKYPEADCIRHDLAASPLPHLEAATTQAFFTPPDNRNEVQREAVKLSDQLAAELLESDVLLLSMPMWNFGVPSSIKSWIDHVVRSGLTFEYTQAGVKGLAATTRAILVVASGGVFADGPMSGWDHLVPYVTHILNFVGIKDIQVVRVEGTVWAPQDAMSNASKAIQSLTL
jgi:FMN-dependent NADH-azoreductase